MSNHMMKAIRVHRYGTSDELKLEQVRRPEPQDGEILVRVHAAGVLPSDAAIRRGLLPGILPKSFPYTPGTAFAGIVEKVGSRVTRFREGQAVCGRSPHGTYADYTVVAADAQSPSPNSVGYTQSSAVSPVALKPSTLNLDQAATLSGGATTAWTALFEDGKLQAGQTVLVHAAAGGVGLFAVQFAKWKGTHVIGTASAVNLDFVRSLGADVALDYTTTSLEASVQGVDVVLDTIGGDTLLRSMHMLKPGEVVVSIVEQPPQALAPALRIRAIKNAVLPSSAHLQAVGEVIDGGYARPWIRQVFQLEEAQKAHELCETGHGRGRIVLHIHDEI